MGIVLNAASGLIELEPDEEFPGSPSVAALPPELRPEPETELPGAPDPFAPGGALEPPRPYWEPYVPGPEAPEPEQPPVFEGLAERMRKPPRFVQQQPDANLTGVPIIGGVSNLIGNLAEDIQPDASPTDFLGTAASAIPPIAPIATVATRAVPGLVKLGAGLLGQDVIEPAAAAIGKAGREAAEELGPAVRRFMEEETGAVRPLYRETNIERADAFLPTSVTRDQKAFEEVYLATSPDFALGQGQNKGVLLEFDGDKLKSNPNRQHVWASMLEENPEFIAKFNDQQDYQKALTAVTIRTDALADSVAKRRVRTTLDRLEAAGWTKTIDADGNTTYRREAAKELGSAVRRFMEEETGAFNLNPFAGPAAPSLGHIPPGGPLQRTLDMLKQEAPRSGPTLSERYRGVQEQLTDRFAGINGLTAAARKDLAKQGQALPMELNAENLAARVPGAGEAGVQRIRDMVSDLRVALDKGAWPDAEVHLNAYLRRKHDLDILAAKGTGRKVVGGLQGPAEVQQALDELQSALGPQRWTQIEDAGKIAIAHNQAGMDRMVQSGLMAQDLADALKQRYPHYTPTRILKHLADEADGVSKRKLSVTSANLKRFTEEGTEAAAARPLDALMESFMQREALIARNDAAKAIAGLAEQQGIGKRIAAVRKVATLPGTPPVPIYRRPPGEIPGTISFMHDGKRVVYDVPKWLENEAKLLRDVDFGPVVRFLGALNEIPRKAFVTYNPSWPIANFMIDTFTNLVQGADVREIGKGLVGAIKDIGNNDPVLAEMRRLGAGQAGFFGRTPADLGREVQKAGGLVIGSKLDMKQFLKNPLRLIGRLAEGQENIGRALEMANRRAAFTTGLKAGATPEEAALTARRATLDFNRGGQFVRQANTAFLFLNASVQGALLPARALRDNPRARLLLGAAMGAKFASDAYNMQYPEYQDIPRNVRYGSWIVMLPSAENDGQGKPKPNYLAVIPNTREWGTFLGPVTYLTEKLFGAAQPAFTQFVATVLPRVQPIEGITSIVPTQIGTTILENSLNRDMYRNRPIVPPELEGKPPTEQYDDRTSESIKALAQKMGISPLQLQHVYYGLTGGAGRAALSIIDPAFASLNPKPEDFRIADLAGQYEGIQDPAVPADEVGLRRRELLNGLSVEDQRAVLDMTRERKQQETVPILSDIARRFSGSQTGELRRLGQEAAERELLVSAKQTENRSRALSDFFDQERKDQEAQDRALSDNPGNAEQWREAHKASGIRFEGALRAFDVVFPNAADLQDSEKWREYQSKVYTIAGSIPDRRTKGKLLVAGYRAIPLEAIDPLTEDFATFFQRREEYRASLTDDDRALLDRELDASRTKTEQEYAKDQETLRPYWEIADNMQKGDPLLQKVLQSLQEAVSTGDVARQKAIEAKPIYRDYKTTLETLQLKMRQRNDAVQEAGRKWYGWKAPK